LCEFLASLHDVPGHVAIPGFYESVLPAARAEREKMRRAGPDDRDFLSDAGASQGWGEPGYSLYERSTIRPALVITGVTGGYQGTGAKAVLPAAASAKLDIRLVPEQDPDDIERLFRRHVAHVVPPAVRVEVRRLLTARPASVSRYHPAVRAAAAACRDGFGVPPAFLRLGGSIPIVDTFKRALGVPTVLMGFALPDDALHAPNEKLHLPTFFRGVVTAIAFLQRFSKTSRIARYATSPRATSCGGSR